MPFEIDEEKLWEITLNYGVPAVKVLLIIIVALLVAGWANRIVRGACERAKIEATLGRFFGKAARWIVLLLAAMFCISAFELDIAGFAVVLGAAGLAIGLAFQGTLSNLASGVMLLIFRPFKVGDFVNVAGQSGKVDEIDLFSTTFDTPDNRRIITPNSAIFGAQIENVTFHDTRRVEVVVGVEYSSDIDKTRQVLEAAAAGVEGCLDDPARQVYLAELGASSVDWKVRVWCPTADFWAIREALVRAVKMALDEAGIGIPFPQVDVHLDSSDKPS